MRQVTWWLIATAAINGCKRKPTDPSESGPFAPGAATLLSIGSPTKDEDPSVVGAADGRMVVGWFSDRGGNSDVYVAATGNGTDWTAAVRVTTNSNGDFYPSLYQDEEGTFHLTWFRWNAPELGSIFYNTSPDGISWNPGSEVQVTRAFLVDDWVPTITRAPDGSLVIYFVSRKRNGGTTSSEIYVSVKRPTDSDWQPAVIAAGINSSTEHDHLPVIVRTAANQLVLVWVRSDTRNPVPWSNPKADVYLTTSSDGLTWAAPSRITTESGDVVNIFPSVYRRATGDWWLTWLSNRTGPPRVFEIPLASATQYPTGRVEITELGVGYSHRIASTPNQGVYLGVWVQGPDGAQDIYYRFFRR
jgi:hypothetical protein